ncbi:MAG: hypothetical protein AVDCRST_MAG19-2352 [uncultured Thermomicrobiales bacterium]|uniref:Uncharacterized protein n=1 Tax=uncultured Thermomicrobiales bacterium TaxID=1645740 RepID=A0A6J4V3G7_9BACT|nr:MAG: hypothetical protein AVDCRST_MAG19-2352 [uncultured Thermomicrobiales bacterium]
MPDTWSRDLRASCPVQIGSTRLRPPRTVGRSATGTSGRVRPAESTGVPLRHGFNVRGV